MPYQCTIPQQPIGLHLHFPEKAIAQKKQNNVAFPFSIGLQFDRREYYIRRLKNLRIYRYTVKKKEREGRATVLISDRFFFIPSVYWRTLLLRVSASPIHHPPSLLYHWFFLLGLSADPQWLLRAFTFSS